MIDIPDTQMCCRPKGCACQTSPTKFVSCKFIVPARSPGEPVNVNLMKKEERRKEVEEAFQQVEHAVARVVHTTQHLGSHPLNAAARREQAKAFGELSQAQYRLSEAFTFVPPKAGDEEVSNPVS